MSDKEDDSSSLLKGNSGGVSSDSTERYSLRKTSLSLTDEEKRERWEAEYAELFEEGGEFELSIDLVEEHREKFKEAERRWAATGNRTKRCSPLDDPGSQLYAWWNDPIDGPMAMLEVRTSALRVKHALMPFLRAGLIGGCVIGPLAFPMRAALICSRARFGLHILWPAIFLCSTAWATLRKVKAGAEVQRANAAHILSAQHLLGASIIWTLSAIHWHAGDVLAALIFGACGRLCLWPGLWYWRDLNRELLIMSSSSGAHLATRCWRLLVSGSILSEAVLLGSLAFALDAAVTAQDLTRHSTLFALPAPLGAMSIALLGGTAASVQTWVSRVVSTGIRATLGLLGLTRVASRFVRAFTPNALRIVAVAMHVGILCYIGYWLAFPLEVGERTEWSASIRPRREPVGTLSYLLLRCSRIVRPAASVKVLRREQLAPGGVRRVQLVNMSDLGATGFATAEDAEDGALLMWSLSVHDQREEDLHGGIPFDEYMYLNSPSRGKRKSPGIGKGRLDSFFDLPDDDFGTDRTPELAKLLLKEEEEGGPPAELLWTREGCEEFLDEYFLNKSKIDGQPVPQVAQVLRAEAALRHWNNDPPPGYKPPNVTFFFGDEVKEPPAYEKPPEVADDSVEAAVEPMILSPPAYAGNGSESMGGSFFNATGAATDPRVAALLNEHLDGDEREV